MKLKGEFNRTIVIEQCLGGYIIVDPKMPNSKRIYPNFYEAIDSIAFSFGLTSVGENIYLQKDEVGK